MEVTSETPKWQIARQAAQLLEEAENLLEMTDSGKYQALGRDIRSIEVEVLRFALDDKGD